MHCTGNENQLEVDIQREKLYFCDFNLGHLESQLLFKITIAYNVGSQVPNILICLAVYGKSVLYISFLSKAFKLVPWGFLGEDSCIV